MCAVVDVPLCLHVKMCRGHVTVCFIHALACLGVFVATMCGVMGRWECQETFSKSRGAQLDAIYIDNALFYYVTLFTLLTLFTWTWDARTQSTVTRGEGEIPRYCVNLKKNSLLKKGYIVIFTKNPFQGQIYVWFSENDYWDLNEDLFLSAS